MRLTDRLQIVDAATDSVLWDRRAYVGHQSAVVVDPAGQETPTLLTVDELRALIDPLPELDREAHRVRWRGDLYTVKDAPLVRRKGQQDHHYTLTLVRVSA